MNFDEARVIFEKLYDDVNGFEISMNSRKINKLSSKDLTYGEIEFESFSDILNVTKPKNNEIFYDLGCGTGKPVFASALLHPFSKAIGVELLPEIFQEAKKVLEMYTKMASSSSTDVQFLNANILELDWSDGDVIYIASTCFDADFMKQLARKAEKLKPGSRVITLTKELESPELELNHRKVYPMTWGDTTVHVFKRK